MTVRADDQDIVRAGLTMILGAQPGIEVVGEAADGREAVALARALRPDVCLLDIQEAPGPRFQRPVDVLVEVEGGYHDDRQRLIDVGPGELPGCFNPVHLRHVSPGLGVNGA